MTNQRLWVSKARIVSLDKVYPDDTLVQGVPLEQQVYYDCNPHYVGGCGTYRLLTGKIWEMHYLVYKPGPGVNEPLTFRLNIHQYFTEILLPRLGWNRVSPQRLERIRGLLVGKKISLRSSAPIRYGELAEDFLPMDFDSWDQLFDSILSGLD